MLAGTADDYTIKLFYVSDCADADIEVQFVPAFSVLAGCTARVDFSFPQPNPFLARHYSLVLSPTLSKIPIVLDASLEWDFGPQVFVNGFEAGATSAWADTVP
jgi:hypothetical protein